MAIYAGETVRIFADLSGWDGNPLDPSGVSAALAAITDSSGTVLVEAAAMTWNATVQRWMYQWNTSVEGTYTIEVVFETPEGRSVDVRNVRLDAPRRFKPVVRGTFFNIRR